MKINLFNHFPSGILLGCLTKSDQGTNAQACAEIPANTTHINVLLRGLKLLPNATLTISVPCVGNECEVVTEVDNHVV